MEVLHTLRTAMDHLEAALRELDEKSKAEDISPSLAAEIENGLIEVTTKISELERKLEDRRRPAIEDAKHDT